VQVTRNGGFNPFESADEKVIYYAKSESDESPVWKAPANGGEETQVLDSVYRSAFAVSRNGIYFILPPGVRYFTFATGISKPVLAIEKPPPGLDRIA